MDYLNKLEIYLNKNGLKMTAPRKVIIECLDELSSHFTLDDLLKGGGKRTIWCWTSNVVSYDAFACGS